MESMAHPALRRASTRDFDEQASLLQGWNQHYAQISSGRFQGAIVEARFEDVHLFAESTSHALFQSGRLPDDLIAIGVPLRATRNGMFCGHPMHRDAIHLFSGSDGFEFHSPDRLTMGGIVLRRSALHDWLDGEALAGRHAGLHTVAPESIRAARHFLAGAFDLCQGHPAMLESPNFRTRLRTATLACAADLLAGIAETPELYVTPRRCAALVRQAQEYLESQWDEAPSVEALCLRLGVSRRTLQYSFQAALGVNPVAYLRARRLNGARQLLKQACPVTEAATTWGFWHFGHFAEEYRKLFGERPSETLRRAA